MFCLCRVPRCVPNKSGWFIWKLPPWVYSCRAEEQFARFVFKTKRATDWQTSLGLWQTQSVAGVYFPNWYGPGVRWYRDPRHVTRGLCRTSRRYNPRDGGAVKWCRIFNIWLSRVGCESRHCRILYSINYLQITCIICLNGFIVISY